MAALNPVIGVRNPNAVHIPNGSPEMWASLALTRLFNISVGDYSVYAAVWQTHRSFTNPLFNSNIQQNAALNMLRTFGRARYADAVPVVRQEYPEFEYLCAVLQGYVDARTVPLLSPGHLSTDQVIEILLRREFFDMFHDMQHRLEGFNAQTQPAQIDALRATVINPWVDRIYQRVEDFVRSQEGIVGGAIYPAYATQGERFVAQLGWNPPSNLYITVADALEDFLTNTLTVGWPSSYDRSARAVNLPQGFHVDIADHFRFQTSLSLLLFSNWPVIQANPMGPMDQRSEVVPGAPGMECTICSGDHTTPDIIFRRTHVCDHIVCQDCFDQQVTGQYLGWDRCALCRRDFIRHVRSRLPRP